MQTRVSVCLAYLVRNLYFYRLFNFFPFSKKAVSFVLESSVKNVKGLKNSFLWRLYRLLEGEIRIRLSMPQNQNHKF